MEKGKDKVAKELQDYSKRKLDEAVKGKSEEEIVAALENYNKSIEATSKDQDIYPMPALEMGKKAAAAIGSIGGIYLAGVSLNQEDTVSRSDEDNLMRSMMSFNVGTIAVGAAAAVALGAAWGAARIGYEADKQFNNYGDANIRGSLTTSMNALNSLEEKHFSTDNPAFTLLKELEKEIIEEGHERSPELNTMRKMLSKAQLLRESILNTSHLSTKAKQQIYEQSSKVVESFKSWGKIEQGRHNPILAIVSDVANYVRPEIKVMEKPGGMAEKVSNSRNSSDTTRAR